MPTDLPTMANEAGKHDPLGNRWFENFLEDHGRPATDADRQDRLFSLIVYGSGPEGSWTDEDWTFYSANREALWKGRESWPAEKLAEGYDRFQIHLERLAGYYGNNREDVARFSRSAGLIWGGIAYQGSAFKALARAAVGDHLLQLHEGVAGWKAKYLDDLNPAHHWIAAFLAGFYYGEIIGASINTIRDIAQFITGQGGTKGDIILGNVAAKHGNMLSHSFAGGSPTYAGLISRMRQDLAVNGGHAEEV